ncbi:fibronectin type III domain-containing protein [Bacteroides sp.]|uniref:fibronectin type III domain-containing protein n=1 Tax=Bacteroides sp. TaxID=29523 RepID=UPI00260F4BE4|nr:fibronectin type III domain-containing protein [Bacteroides sp.]
MHNKILLFTCGLLLLCFSGCSKDSTPENEMPTLTTGEATAISRKTATIFGTISVPEGSEVKNCGFLYSTVSSLPEADTKTVAITLQGVSGTYTTTLTGLVPNTKYYYCLYANSGYTTTRSSVREFTTATDGVPALETTTSVSATETSLTVASKISDDGGNDVQKFGFTYKVSGSADTEKMVEAASKEGDGRYTFTITGLTAETSYEVRAFATNAKGTGYGEKITLITGKRSIPQLEDVSVSEIGEDAAMLQSKILSNGGHEITKYGFVYSSGETGQEVQVEVTEMDTDKTFRLLLSKLAAATTYNIRAYATNSSGTAYSKSQSFTTLTKESPVVSLEVSTVEGNSVKVGGIVSSSGTTPIKEVGFCWSKDNATPTIADGKLTSTLDGTSFNSTITGLKAKTTYHIRAYAINEARAGYSEVVTITTPESNVPDIDDIESPDKN